METKIHKVFKINIVFSIVCLNLILIPFFNPSMMSWALTGFVGAGLQIAINQTFAIYQLFKKDFSIAKHYQWGVLMGFLTLMVGFLAYWSYF